MSTLPKSSARFEGGDATSPAYIAVSGARVAKRTKAGWVSCRAGWSVVVRPDGIYVQFKKNPPLKAQ
jgi:hypothetical protein